MEYDDFSPNVLSQYQKTSFGENWACIEESVKPFQQLEDLVPYLLNWIDSETGK